MKCFKCGKTIDDDNTVDFYQIETYGKNRKWVYSKCIKNDIQIRILAKREQNRTNRIFNGMEQKGW